MRRAFSSVAVGAAFAAVCGFACNLDLAPYVDPIDAGFFTVDAGGPDVVSDVGSSDATADAEAGAAKVVFVTSAVTNGHFGGIAGADEICARAAPGKSVIAWVSVDNQAAIDRLKSDGPWVATDMTTSIFANKAAITLTGPAAPIDKDEAGRPIDKPTVWTGTEATGKPSPQNCTGFGSVGLPDPLPQLGLTGTASAKADEKKLGWTEDANLDCTLTAHLYCFEQ